MTATLPDARDIIKPGDILEILPVSQCESRIEVNWSFSDTARCGRELGHKGAHCLVSYSGRVILVDDLTMFADESSDQPFEMSEAMLEFCRGMSAIANELASAMDNAEWALRDLRRKNVKMTESEQTLVENMLDMFNIPSYYDIEVPLDPQDEQTWNSTLVEFLDRREG